MNPFPLPLKTLIYVSFLLLLIIPLEAQQNNNQPNFDQDEKNTIHAGYIRLSWHLDNIEPNVYPEYELQQALNPEFDGIKIRYKGPDKASYISGLKDGDYYFRVRRTDTETGPGPWSAPILVEVRHHSRSFAYWMFGLGGIVFLAIVAVVVHGHFKVSPSYKSEN